MLDTAGETLIRPKPSLVLRPGVLSLPAGTERYVVTGGGSVIVEVEAGDYMWLRAFCPQACYAGGPGLFRYLLYKDVNRHMRLT